MDAGEIVMSPIVVAELLSAAASPLERERIGDLLQEFVLHRTPLEHWMDCGELRRILAQKGVNVTIPDAHVAQCALDLGAVLYSGDGIFGEIAKHTHLRVRKE